MRAVTHWTVVLALIVFLAACSDGGDDDAVAADEGASAAAGCDEPVTVEIPEFRFEPQPVRVAAGCEIVWHNSANQAHTSTGNGDQSWKTGNIQPGERSDAVPFPDAGEFTYICSLHPFMEGTVVIET
jgi:plastocyanin